jgi:mycofactocin biosynthesis protein MftB
MPALTSTTTTTADAATATAYDPARPWALHPQVSLRPESFGALAYHFGTRRLTFLKSRTLLAVVESLADHPSGTEACRAAGVIDDELDAYEVALGALADSGMICERAA